MKNFVITLILGAAIGFGCAKITDQSANAETTHASKMSSLLESLSPGTVVSVRVGEIKEGVSKEDAKQIGKEWLAAWNEVQPDVKWLMAEIDTGEHAGQPGMITIMADDEIRKSYWPGDGSGGTEKLTKVTESPALQAAGAKAETAFSNWVYVGDFVIE